MSTSSLRAHTEAMVTLLQGVVSSAWTFRLPYMVNPDEGKRLAQWKAAGNVVL
jgi:hypothetical protein